MPSIFTVRRSPCDPGVQNVWTHNVCRGAVMMSLNIFENIRIALGEEEKRDGHPLRMNISGHFH